MDGWYCDSNTAVPPESEASVLLDHYSLCFLVTTVHRYKVEDDKSGLTKEVLPAGVHACFECGLKPHPTLSNVPASPFCSMHPLILYPPDQHKTFAW